MFVGVKEKNKSEVFVNSRHVFFYECKPTEKFLATLRSNYFFEYEIPKTEGLLTRLKSKNKVTMDIKAEEIL